MSVEVVGKSITPQPGEAGRSVKLTFRLSVRVKVGEFTGEKIAGQAFIPLWVCLSVDRISPSWKWQPQRGERRPLSWRKLPTTYSCTFTDKLLAGNKLHNLYILTHTHKVSLFLSYFLFYTHKPREFKRVKASQVQYSPLHMHKMPMRTPAFGKRVILTERMWR